MTGGRRAGLAALAVGGAAALLPACERREVADQDVAPQLTLAIETPEALHWGGTGVLRVTLANEGDATAEGGIVEVRVPDWLEFGTVEPPGTAVTVVSGDDETRLLYQLTDSLPPGELRTVTQHLRVLSRPPTTALADTVETVQLPPINQAVRARLLTPAGQPAGVEVQATLNFMATPPLPPTLPGDTPMPADTLPPVDTAGPRPPGAPAPGGPPPGSSQAPDAARPHGAE